MAEKQNKNWFTSHNINMCRPHADEECSIYSFREATTLEHRNKAAEDGGEVNWIIVYAFLFENHDVIQIPQLK